MSEDAENYDDRREKPRRTVLWGAQLLSEEYAFECHVRNFSMGGAQVFTVGRVALGPSTILMIPKVGGIPCDVVWQVDNRAGLRFATDDPNLRARIVAKGIALGVEPSLDVPADSGPDPEFDGAEVIEGAFSTRR